MAYISIDLFKEIAFCILISLFAYAVISSKGYLKRFKELPTWNKVLIILFSFIFGIWYTRVFSGYAIIRIADATIISFVAILWLYFSKINLTPRKLKFKDITIISTTTFILVVLFFLSIEVLYSHDSLVQYNCAASGQYDNWHPFIHTFLFFTVPMSIFGQHEIVPIITEMIFVIIAFIYINCSLYRMGINKKLILLLLLLFFINKTIIFHFTCLTKDIPYSMAIIVLTINCFEIYFSDGAWLNKLSNKIILLIASILVLTLRHNGILSFLAIGIVLVLTYKPYRKFLALSFSSILIIFIILTGPIYNAIGIYPHSEKFTEKLGVPNNQICYIITQQGNVTDEQLEFINNCYDLDKIPELYNVGNFNPVKWRDNGKYYHPEFIDNNRNDFFANYIKIVIANPKLAIMGYYHNIKKMFEVTFVISPLTSIKWNEGFCMLISTIGLLILSLKRKWKKMIPFIPIYINFIGVMGVLTGWELRFILCSTIGCIYLLVFSVCETKTKPDQYEQI